MKNIIFVFTMLLFCNFSFAQVGIGTTNPDPSSVLDINSTDKGILIPRVTSYPSNPAVGLLVYREDLSSFSCWNGTSWTQSVFGNISGSNIYNVDGALSANRIVTQNDKNLTFNATSGNFIFDAPTTSTTTGNFGIRTTSPMNALHTVGGALFGTQSNTTDAQLSNLSNAFNIVSSTKMTAIGISTPETALRLIRSGTAGTKSNAVVDFKIGTYSGSINGKSALRIALSEASTNGSDIDVMTLNSNGNVGIGITSPLANLTVNTSTSINMPTTSLNLQDVTTFKPVQRIQFTGANNNALSSYITANSIGVQAHNFTLGTPLPYVLQPTGGNVSIGIGNSTPSPISVLDVNGSVTNTVAFDAVAGTTIDYSKSNLAFTNANPGAFTINNIKDGGTYTLAVKGVTQGTSTFTSTGFTFKTVNNGQTIAGKETLYTFIVMGSTVYFFMTPGF